MHCWILFWFKFPFVWFWTMTLKLLSVFTVTLQHNQFNKVTLCWFLKQPISCIILTWSPLHSPQYPATIVLLVIIAVFGFVKPYNSMIGNILETAFAVDIMVLLFLRNTQQIKDKLQVLQLRNLSSNECEDPVEGITNLTTLLLPFYYIPLAVTLTAVLMWSGMAVW